MFKKITRSKLMVFAGMALCAAAIFAAPAASLTTYASDGSDVSVCADIIEWRYRIEDGKVYKALYNYSTGEFISDWIYVCDYPEGI